MSYWFPSRSSTMHFLGLSSIILSLLILGFTSTLAWSLFYVDFSQFHALRLLFPCFVLNLLLTGYYNYIFYWFLALEYLALILDEFIDTQSHAHFCLYSLIFPTSFPPISTDLIYFKPKCEIRLQSALNYSLFLAFALCNKMNFFKRWWHFPILTAYTIGPRG